MSGQGSPTVPALHAFGWGLLSLFAFVFSFNLLLWLPTQAERLLGLPHDMALGVWVLVSLIAAGGLTLPAARLTLGEWPRVGPRAWAVLALGAFVSAWQMQALAAWTIGRFGAFDIEFVGPTWALFAVVGGIAVAGFGVQAARRDAVWVPLTATLVGLLLFISLISANAPGLRDGLAPDRAGLAASFVAAAGYVGVIAILSQGRLRRPRRRATAARPGSA